jgi:DNA-binding IclR family transcriptional regulator
VGENHRVVTSPSAPDSQLAKAVTLLTAFTANDRTLTLAELRNRTGLAKSTVHRLLGDLVEVGLLDRIGQRYRLSALVFDLGMRASIERRLIEVATPFMEDLYELTHETVHLGVRDGTDVIYVFKIAGHRQATSPSRIGGRMPLHCTAIGKALLAFGPPELTQQVVAGGLERRGPRTITAPGMLSRQLVACRQRGVAFEAEESAVGLTCVAAAILDPDDVALAAVSVTGPVTRFKPQAHAEAVRAAAAGISATLARRYQPVRTVT